jgi:Protein of unknown function (DUF3592)
MHGSIIVLLFGVGFIIYGLVKIYQVSKHKKLIEDSKSWPSSSAIVTNSEIKYSNTKNGRHYWVEIAYKYSVLGLENIAKKKIYNWSQGKKETATNIANAHPIGSAITVRYNPNNLQEHVADFEQVTSGDITLIVISLISGILIIIFSTFVSDTP